MATLTLGACGTEPSSAGFSSGTETSPNIVPLDPPLQAAPGALPMSPLYEAEDALFDGPSLHSGRGSSNDGYLDFSNASGDYIEWTIEAPAPGRYQASFAYQLGTTQSRPLQLQVNGEVVDPSTDFPPTGDWMGWTELDHEVVLHTGPNQLRLTAIGLSGPNFDYLATEFVGVTTPTTAIRINFSDASTPAPASWQTDSGEPFGDRQGGLRYGWQDPQTGAPVSLSPFGRNRPPTPDVDIIRETLMHMDHPSPGAPDGQWEIELENGMYRVVVQGGDVESESTPQTRHTIRAEGVTVVDFLPEALSGVRQGVQIVEVSDGRLTLDGIGGLNTKIHAVIIESLDGGQTPVVVGTVPVDGTNEVPRDSVISANFLSLPNSGANGATSLDNSTINDTTVRLFRLAGAVSEPVPVSVNGSGGGDAINLTPTEILEGSTRYRFVIDGVRDFAGVELLPFSAEFVTTQTLPDTSEPFDNVHFNRVGPVALGAFTSLTLGPDDRLYGLAFGGGIHRWELADDGSLENEEILDQWTQAFGPRIAIGFAFAPDASAEALTAYVTHSTLTDLGMQVGPAWDGTLSRVSGPQLEEQTLLVTNLPRSVRDHLTNGLAFDPNDPNILYIVQGSNSAGGQADSNWGNRPERLLSAALLRVDLTALPLSFPLDAQTSVEQAIIDAADPLSATLADGTYNPYFEDAPLTLYATGLRNAYDLTWHSNGQLYIPTNGTASPSSSPASVSGTRRPDGGVYDGPAIPEIVGNPHVQHDFLFRVDPLDPGGYYGHPNPTRGEYVLNRAAVDSPDQYPASLSADPNYRGFAYDFGLNRSPNGVIEYRSQAHIGQLSGALLVTRYSGGSDIIALRPDELSGDIEFAGIGLPGLGGFQDPIDLVEDPREGNLYVSDLGTEQIVLLTPEIPAGGTIELENMTKIPGTDIGFPADDVMGFSHILADTYHRSHEHNVLRIRNIGAQPLVIGALTVSDPSRFSVVGSAPSEGPITIAPNQFHDLTIEFIESSGDQGIREERLSIDSGATNAPHVEVRLNGAYMLVAEGGNEVTAQEAINSAGFGTWIGPEARPSSDYPLPANVAAGLEGDLIVSEYWEQADPNDPVRVVRLAAFKGPGSSNFRFVDSAGAIVGGVNFGFGADWHQSLFPKPFNGTTTLSSDEALSINEPFRLVSAGQTTSGAGAVNPETGYPQRLGIRVYLARDLDGLVIPDAYIAMQDFIAGGCGAGSANCDWNDNIVLITNIEPVGDFFTASN